MAFSRILGDHEILIAANAGAGVQLWSTPVQAAAEKPLRAKAAA